MKTNSCIQSSLFTQLKKLNIQKEHTVRLTKPTFVSAFLFKIRVEEKVLI